VSEVPLTPQDVNGDGLYEDVNGDGAVTITDVQALFANRDDAVVQNNPTQFDFNGDGQFTVVDVQALFRQVT
jgi:PKD repeat protein